MTIPFPIEELNWWQLPQPTQEELRLSGGLLVEDWPHARQVVRRSARKRVSALAALLRIADALDYSHDGRVLRLVAETELCNERSWTIALWVRPLADLDDEMEHAYEKADLFEKVFKRKLQFLIQD